MNNVKVIHASRAHKEFIIYANKIINNVNKKSSKKQK